ncbi:MAG: response regulator transcription factor [Cytophagales bacterium]|nr:response regulator transcription factor [Cytophaga sp.]
MNVKCIVIDDEPLGVDVLETYISRVPYLTLEAKFNNGVDALAYVNASQVDLLFIDIQMPDINGMDFLKLINKKINIVFTTAYPQYALEGYDFNPVDFLVKPISFDKFMRAVSRVDTPVIPLAETDVIPQYFYIKAKGKTIRILMSDILYMEGLKDYVIFYTSEAKYLSLHSMKELETKLPSKQFLRIHKSYIVELNKIEEVGANYVKICGKQIPVGRQYKQPFQQFVESKKL